MNEFQNLYVGLSSCRTFLSNFKSMFKLLYSDYCPTRITDTPNIHEWVELVSNIL